MIEITNECVAYSVNQPLPIIDLQDVYSLVITLQVISWWDSHLDFIIVQMVNAMILAL